MKDLIKTAVIFAGGEIELDSVNGILKEYEPKLMIAADSGLESMDKLGLFPDMIVGDFDSLSDKSLLEKYKNDRIEIISFPVEKDYTDMRMALDIAIQQDCGRIVMLGAVGSRADHVIGNIFLLLYLRKQNIEGVIINKKNRIRCLSTGEYVFNKESAWGKYISFFPTYEKMTCISLQGFKYDVEELILNPFNIISISNEIKEKSALLSVKNSCLLIVESND